MKTQDDADAAVEPLNKILKKAKAITFKASCPSTPLLCTPVLSLLIRSAGGIASAQGAQPNPGLPGFPLCDRD